MKTSAHRFPPGTPLYSLGSSNVFTSAYPHRRGDSVGAPAHFYAQRHCFLLYFDPETDRIRW